jgi:hypothetical protein
MVNSRELRVDGEKSRGGEWSEVGGKRVAGESGRAGSMGRAGQLGESNSLVLNPRMGTPSRALVPKLRLGMYYSKLRFAHRILSCPLVDGIWA